MPRLSIARAFRIPAAGRPPAPLLSVPRIGTSTISSQPFPQSSSTSFLANQSARLYVAYPHTHSRPSLSLSTPPFASYGRRYYGNGYNYRRFGQTQESILWRLVREAKPYHFVMIGGMIGGVYVYNLDTVEMTGRRRFNCVSHQQELSMGLQSYNEVMQQVRGRILPESHPVTIMVNRVLARLIPLAPIDGADWKVHVIQDDTQKNAFVLPGGKVFVFTGILPICRDEDGLAAVLGHEIAHVIAHHPGERMSTSFVTIGLAFIVSFLFDISGQIPGLFLNLMYTLPNSRTQESEADTIGLMMMAKACFNPEGAIGLWDRMYRAEKAAPPQFMSTHPSSYNRMEALREKLNKAQAIYDDNGCFYAASQMRGFRAAQSGFGW
ncbi:peptidase family M48-domain-containing protein [Aspergillus egyptiacus]|nr:peptidase family M48-domain-containing protein [Aspergillus egyptiacus]